MTDKVGDQRLVVERALRRELFGPQPDDLPPGKPLTITGEVINFPNWEKAQGPWHDEETGEEVLSEIDPARRYGVGILYPAEGSEGEDLRGVTGIPQDEDEADDQAIEIAEQRRLPAEADDDDLDLSDTNSFEQAAIAISFRALLPAGSSLHLAARGLGRYESFPVQVTGAKAPRRWWVRRSTSLTACLLATDAAGAGRKRIKVEADAEDTGNLALRFEAYVRTIPNEENENAYLVTVALMNVTEGRKGSASMLFQAGFEVTARDGAAIIPYPEQAESEDTRAEDDSIALLYRGAKVFGVGHGCAANWAINQGESTQVISADTMPAFETTSLTPVIQHGGRELRVDMRVLAGEDLDRIDRELSPLISAYEAWIAGKEVEAAGLPSVTYQSSAAANLLACRDALRRMKRGRALVGEGGNASLAFRLANKAMLQQQIRSRAEFRDIARASNGDLVVLGVAPPTESADPAIGFWRPFQIGFLLASLEALVNPSGEDRDVVDLIFFPTGGGKTEAYLGAAAVSLFARRLADPTDAGADVLMRYTLRLLTSQQFLRASSLICALEWIRDDNPDALGSTPFSIGIWLGQSMTPNNHQTAVADLRALVKSKRSENPFLLLRCPWCGSRMGPVKLGSKEEREVVGYVIRDNKVAFTCPDQGCFFGGSRKLPIYVVDADIYEQAPSLIIGTVDKFAMIPWLPQARGIFGIADDGTRRFAPPGLIIQDELHLIAGPLGTMVAIYEPVIEELCTDRRAGRAVKPKIIASTATIRRYAEQVRDLYGRSQVALFPPPGIVSGDSFFATTARNDNGSVLPGRRYIGIYAPALGSMQSVQVRVAASLLQAPLELPDDERDPYWTNLWFFNSLRELGNTVSLVQADIPDYLMALRKRAGVEEVRWPRHTLELTSRRRNDEIPTALDELAVRHDKDSAIDICLASSMIEVGVDIDRLSLMTIVGQPKTTAQYIQVSGRVGRQWWSRPGLVVSIYGAAKPRDHSHYERFRSYHERLYAEVEPTSVTPFARPAMKRALHAALVAHVRITSPQSLPPYPFPAEAVEAASEILARRLAAVDRHERPVFDALLRQRTREWSEWERTGWNANTQGGNPIQGLMRYAGTAPAPNAVVPSWEVPTSMRSVDAECELRITGAYAMEAAQRPEGSND